MTPGIFSLIVYAALVLVLIGVLLFLSRWLGEQRENPEKLRPYECGIIPSGSARLPYAAPFYLVAIFFVIFDMEAVFLFAWSVAFYESGWQGFIEALIFIGVLLASLLYLWACGALDWRTRRQRIDAQTIKE